MSTALEHLSSMHLHGIAKAFQMQVHSANVVTVCWALAFAQVQPEKIKASGLSMIAY